MCLDSGHYSVDRTTLVQSGWKDFGTGSALKFQAFQLNGKKDVPLDKWLTAEGTTVSGSNYPAGFHIYVNETEFKGSKYRRVYFRNAHTHGTQDGKTILVAREMFVPSNPDDWPPKT